MPTRFITRALLFLILGIGHTHFARAAKPTPSLTWDTVASYVLTHGGDRTIKAPASRTLGYDADTVNAKGLRVKLEKSKDGREHTFYVVYEPTEKKEIFRPREIVLGSILMTEKGALKEISSYRVRLSIDGKPISAMRAEGVIGKVKQRALAGDSKDTADLLAAEMRYFLRETPLSQLTE